MTSNCTIEELLTLTCSSGAGNRIPAAAATCERLFFNRNLLAVTLTMCFTLPVTTYELAKTYLTS